MIVKVSSSIKDPKWKVQCDRCQTSTKEYGVDPGCAADRARHEGFTTFQRLTDIDPLDWVCPTCSTKPMN